MVYFSLGLLYMSYKIAIMKKLSYIALPYNSTLCILLGLQLYRRFTVISDYYINVANVGNYRVESYK